MAVYFPSPVWVILPLALICTEVANKQGNSLALSLEPAVACCQTVPSHLPFPQCQLMPYSQFCRFGICRNQFLTLLCSYDSKTKIKTKDSFCFFPVSSCITTYKKTPPPVPPRTTTKPFISITAQSSTESAQDAYMDGQGQRGDIISQSGLSNSTESLDSMKALTAAIEAANAQIHGPASQHVGNNTATVTTTTTIATVAVEDRKKDHFKKNRCLSIGIQVR